MYCLIIILWILNESDVHSFQNHLSRKHLGEFKELCKLEKEKSTKLQPASDSSPSNSKGKMSSQTLSDCLKRKIATWPLDSHEHKERTSSLPAKRWKFLAACSGFSLKHDWHRAVRTLNILSIFEIAQMLWTHWTFGRSDILFIHGWHP